MKYLVLLIDGMGDHVNEKLDNQTPMMVANIPNMRALCHKSIFGKVKTIPDGMAPSSDVGNLGLLGYEPEKFHRGRGGFEALDMALDLKVDDLVMRCNLICLSDALSYEDKIILDSAGGGIGSEDGSTLMEDLLKFCPPPVGKLFVNEGYKHLLHIENSLDVKDALGGHEYLQTAIKDLVIDKVWEDYYQVVNTFLDRHPINVKRNLAGLKKANGLWFWALGRPYDLQGFQEKYKLKPAMVATSSLILGMGKALAFKTYALKQIYRNNFEQYLSLVTKVLDSDCDFLYIHLEGVDEASHEGNLEKKIKLLEGIDAFLLGPLCHDLKARNMEYRLMVVTDHASPVALRKHTSEPIPYFIYDSEETHLGTLNFSESMDEKGQRDFNHGTKLFNYFTKGQ